jgi:hypothetical protein
MPDLPEMNSYSTTRKSMLMGRFLDCANSRRRSACFLEILLDNTVVVFLAKSFME